MSISNNNPGNLRPGTKVWHGQTGIDAGNFIVFDSDISGIRAMAITLSHYMRTGYDTIASIIAHYSTEPGQPVNQNYIDYVAEYMNQDQDALLDLDHETITDLVDAMIQFELGDEADQVSSQDIDTGIANAEHDVKNMYIMPAGQMQQPQPKQPAPNNNQVQKPPAQNTDVLPGNFKLPAMPPVLQMAGVEWWEVGLLALLALAFIRTRN